MKQVNPIDNFIVDPGDLQFIGADLQRPECILADRDGYLWVADARGGIVNISPDGATQIISQNFDARFSQSHDERSRYTSGTLPNGLAFASNGDIVISNFGTDRLELMKRDGITTVLADTLDGKPIGKVNFVLRDSRDRLWITVSTRITDWPKALNPNVSDGFIALYDQGKLRIVADNLCFTNEIRFDAKEEWLYAVETCGCRIVRFRVLPDGSLADKQIYGPSDHGAMIDGIAFDEFGNLWGTHVFTDRIFAITPEGDLRIILDDCNPEPTKVMMKQFRAGKVTFEELAACGSSHAPWFASVTFGGPDLKTVYIGSLRGSRIPYFRSPVAGLPMIHWNEKVR